jgi:hypothetical protein
MVLFLLGILIGFVVGAVGAAFFCMVADMSSTRPGGQVLDFTGAKRASE